MSASKSAQMWRSDSLRRRAMLRVCPKCGALAMRACTGARGAARKALHADRVALARSEYPA